MHIAFSRFTNFCERRFVGYLDLPYLADHADAQDKQALRVTRCGAIMAIWTLALVSQIPQIRFNVKDLTVSSFLSYVLLELFSPVSQSLQISKKSRPAQGNKKHMGRLERGALNSSLD